MKIIQICPRYYPDIGGVETHVQEISERLVKGGHIVEVVCTDPHGIHPKTDLINGVQITRFRSLAPNDAYYFAPGMVFYLKKCDATILHAHGYHAFPALFAEMASMGKRFIFTPHYHGRGHTWFRNLLLKCYDVIAKRIFYRADKIICVSEYEKKLITKRFDIKEEKFKIIPNGINYSEFVGVKVRKNPNQILYIGRIEEYKLIHHIIRALPQLPQFTLTIVGRGPYEAQLHNLASRMKVTERITWKKDLSRKELIQEYKSAGVFISLSSKEAYGITVAEALASGLPAIVNYEGALSEFIDGEICVGIEPNPEQLADAIRSLKTSTSYKKRILDWDEVVERIIEIYSNE